ncbi:hypothetical protein A2U01_0095906, partial [Trifolium medium]|nr:hypothetical protein [Trifolium medium]
MTPLSVVTGTQDHNKTMVMEAEDLVFLPFLHLLINIFTTTPMAMASSILDHLHALSFLKLCS